MNTNNNWRQGRGPMSVWQEWTFALSFMQQTVLATAVRGPDTIDKYHPAKYLLRWYRRCILVSSLDGEVIINPTDPRGGSFMGPSFRKERKEGLEHILSQYIAALDSIPHHFHMHLMHAFEIVGYHHPDADIAVFFQNAYFRFVNDMHLNPETQEELDRRLSDSRTEWLRKAEPATVT